MNGTIESKIISKELTTDFNQSETRFLWIIVAFMPSLLPWTAFDINIWALFLVLGGWVANKHPLRWVALAWITSVLFPQMPFLLLACCGALLFERRQYFFAILFGLVLSVVPVPGELKNMGSLLIIIGLISIIYNRLK